MALSAAEGEPSALNIALETSDYRVAEDLKFLRSLCSQEKGKCTGVPDEVDVALWEMHEEWDKNSFLFRNPVEAYRGVILIPQGGGEDWGRPKGVFRVEHPGPRSGLGGVYEARLVPWR